MKIIKDPVHGYIEVEEPLLPLLDSPVLQRLRYIRQLGFSYLVYPGANHTRFEHSLGTMHLASVMCRELMLDAESRMLVVAAALLHDIGHGPFSHAIEPLMTEMTGRTHQDIDGLLDDGMTASCLEETGISTKEIYSVIQGTHPLSAILHGDLDVDRMDYLLRDAHYTGVPYGTVDAHRLIRSTLFAEEEITLHENGINAAESLLIARTLMRPAVYFHHVSRIAETMFLHAVFEHVIDGLTINRLVRLDDAECFCSMLSSDSDVTRMLAKRIYNRNLYKRAIYVGREQVNTAALQRYASLIGIRGIEAEIAEMAGIDQHEVLVDIPPFPSDMSMNVQIKNQHRVIELEELSPLAKTLNETRRAQWRLGVYASSEHLAEVTEAAGEVLQIRPFTKQKKLDVYN